MSTRMDLEEKSDYEVKERYHELLSMILAIWFTSDTTEKLTVEEERLLGMLEEEAIECAKVMIQRGIAMLNWMALNG